MFKFHPYLTLALGCVACGASFTANSGDDSGGSAGRGVAGEASGGLGNSAGSSNAGDAGTTEAGGSSAAGQGSTAGAGGSVVGSGGRSGAGGRWSGQGGWSNGECATLRQEYQAAVEEARVCDKGSTDQCSASSVAEPIGCGCPVLVNAKSEATANAKKAYQALKDSKCDYGGANCAAAPCAPIVSASCSAQTASMSAYVCSSLTGIQN